MGKTGVAYTQWTSRSAIFYSCPGRPILISALTEVLDSRPMAQKTNGQDSGSMDLGHVMGRREHMALDTSSTDSSPGSPHFQDHRGICSISARVQSGTEPSTSAYRPICPAAVLGLYEQHHFAAPIAQHPPDRSVERTRWHREGKT